MRIALNVATLAPALLALASCGGRVDARDADGGSAPSSTSSPENGAAAGAADSAMATPGNPARPGEDSGGITTGSDASAEPVDATPVNAGDGGLTCSDPVHVSIGDALSGSTCGGSSRPIGETPCTTNGPVLYFYVDAPPGAAGSQKRPARRKPP